MKALISELRNKHLVTDSCADILENSLSGIPLELMKRIAKKRPHGKDDKAHASRQEYSDELRSFALMLQFYSTRAYNYVCETFDLELPSLTTIQRWFHGLDGSPGFSKEIFGALKNRSDSEKAKGNECILCIDVG